MPIYEFCCQKCDHVFEELVSASAAENGQVGCPKCRSKKTRRLLSSFSFSSSGAGKAASMGKSGCDSCSKSSCSSCG